MIIFESKNLFGEAVRKFSDILARYILRGKNTITAHYRAIECFPTLSAPIVELFLKF
jgi:hypothetical protein